MPHDDNRIPALDGLRGVAVSLVLVLHFTVFGVERPEAGALKLVYHVFQLGWIGVDLFFVLSGFLITGILYAAKDRDHFFARFYARRTLRIFPLYFGVLAITTALLPWLFPANVRFAGWSSQGIWYWTYATNVLLALSGWHTTSVQGLDHFWSLAVEEQFYLLWPFAVYFLDRRRLVWLCGAAMLLGPCLRTALVLWGNPIAAYVLTPARVDALSAGALVALIATRPSGLQPFRRAALIAAATCGVAFVVVVIGRFTFTALDALVQAVGYSLVATMFAAVVVIALTSPETAVVRCLSRTVPRLLGRYSYGLYVFHHPLLFMMPPATVAAALRSTIYSDVLARTVALALVAGLCGALAVTSWHLYEQRFLRVKTRFDSTSSRFARRRAPAAAVHDTTMV